MSNLRMQKINCLIQKYLSEIINKKFSEKINFVNINFVHTSKDFSSTRVYVSLVSSDQKKEFIKLQKIKKSIQREFGQKINFKRTPIIEFILDTKQNQIDKVEKILDKILKQNEN